MIWYGDFNFSTVLPIIYLSLSLSLSLDLSTPLSLYPSIPLSLYPSLPLYLPISLSPYLSISLSLYLSISLSLYLSISLSLYLSISLSLYLSIFYHPTFLESPALYPFLHLRSYLYIYFSRSLSPSHSLCLGGLRATVGADGSASLHQGFPEVRGRSQHSKRCSGFRA